MNDENVKDSKSTCGAQRANIMIAEIGQHASKNNLAFPEVYLADRPLLFLPGVSFNT